MRPSQSVPGLNTIAVHHLGINNLPKPAKEGIAELLGGVEDLLEGVLRTDSIKPN